jgi:hypothetical protein
MEARDRAGIKKRERAGNELTIPKLGVLPESQFPEPPGRRMSPWTVQNASGTDIIVGSCDEKGMFQGLILTDVQMQTLLRFFSMASTYMPRDAPPQLNGLAAQLRDGMATLVVTRSAFGREMDGVRDGPERNGARPAIWEEVRKARVMNPSLHITCIDAPASITGAQLSNVLVQPLSDYRELSFYEGVWYVPSYVEDKKLGAAFVELNQPGVAKKPLWWTRVASREQGDLQGMPAAEKPKKQDELFNRKAFTWRSASDQNDYFHKWKPVYTDENYVKDDDPPVVRDFTGPTIHKGGGLAQLTDEGE